MLNINIRLKAVLLSVLIVVSTVVGSFADSSVNIGSRAELEDDTDIESLIDLDKLERAVDFDNIIQNNKKSLVVDSDNDGIIDYLESDLGTSPAELDSDGDGIDDGDEIYTIVKSISNGGSDKIRPTLQIELQGRLLETLLFSQVSENNFYLPKTIPGYIDNGCEISLDGEFKSAELSFKVGDAVLNDTNCQPAVYYCDEENQQLIYLENQVWDKVQGEITVKINRLAKYIVLNKIEFDKSQETPLLNLLGVSSQDTDGDGISDYYENLISSGELKAFNGITIQLDAHNADTDGDGLRDGEEVQIVRSRNGREKLRLLSRPDRLDTDYDGMPDGCIDYDYPQTNKFVKADPRPLDNSFRGVMRGYSLKPNRSKAIFNVDYTDFFADNTVYNTDISKLSMIYANEVYRRSILTKAYFKFKNGIRRRRKDDARELFEIFGMKDVRLFDIGKDKGDDDVTEIAIGHRYVEFNGEKKEIILTAVRGTDLSIEEWSSNFDIGADTPSYYQSIGYQPKDWLQKKDHKGFNVAANRAKAQIDEYLKQANLMPDAQKVIWITGHSRGGGIANILGALYEKEAGFESYTYTFAAPNTTCTAEDEAVKYRTVFNIINTDDFVAKVPLKEWGFRKYGRTKGISIADNYSLEWVRMVGCLSYDSYPNLPILINSLAMVAKSREGLYNTHIKDSDSRFYKIIKLSLTERKRERKIAEIPMRARRFCKIVRYNGIRVLGVDAGGWDFEVYQSPAYFMQLIASAVGREISIASFAGGLRVAPKYKLAKLELVKGAIPIIGGIMHPHFTDSYLLLADKYKSID